MYILPWRIASAQGYISARKLGMTKRIHQNPVSGGRSATTGNHITCKRILAGPRHTNQGRQVFNGSAKNGASLRASPSALQLACIVEPTASARHRHVGASRTFHELPSPLLATGFGSTPGQLCVLLTKCAARVCRMCYPPGRALACSSCSCARSPTPSIVGAHVNCSGTFALLTAALALPADDEADEADDGEALRGHARS